MLKLTQAFWIFTVPYIRMYLLSRAINFGRQCHFKIWLDCHKFKKMSLPDNVHVNSVKKIKKKMTINAIQRDDRLWCLWPFYNGAFSIASMSFQNLVRLSQIKKNSCLTMSLSTKCQKMRNKCQTWWEVIIFTTVLQWSIFHCVKEWHVFQSSPLETIDEKLPSNIFYTP
jgi:hypothetical protein